MKKSIVLNQSLAGQKNIGALKTFLKNISPFNNRTDMPSVLLVLKKVFAFYLCYWTGIFLAEGLVIGGLFACGKNFLHGEMFSDDIMMLIKLYGMIVVIAASVLYWKLIEKRKLSEMGVTKNISGWFIGAVVGILLLIVSVSAIMVTGTIKFDGVSTDLDITMPLMFGGYAVQGAAEEFLSRGVVFHGLKGKVSMPVAVGANALVFTLPHLSTLGGSEPQFIISGVINLAVISCLFSFITLKDKDDNRVTSPTTRLEENGNRGNGNHNGNMGNDRGGRGNGNHNGNMGNDRGGRGNDRGGRGSDSNGRHDNDRGHDGGNHHGYGPSDRGGHSRPYNYNDHPHRDHFSWSHSHHNWSRPLPPPPRPYRPAPLRYYRPVIPAHYRPYYGAPVIDRILGLMFGTYYDMSLDYLYTNGYYIDGYQDNIIYLRDVRMLNLLWPDVMLSYDGGRLANAQFVYATTYRDRARYNRLYHDLSAVYGPPISVESGMATWFGGNTTGYVTLSMGTDYGRYYTTLSIGY